MAIRFPKALPHLDGRDFRLRVEQRQSLAPLFVRDAENDARLIVHDLVNRFFDLEVRHHFTRDLAEPRQPIHDVQEAVSIHARQIAGLVIAIHECLRGSFGIA